MRQQQFEDLILRSRAIAGATCVHLAAMRGVSKDGREDRASWFETRRCAALLTMRVKA